MIKILEKHPIVTICGLVLIMLLPNLDSLQVTIMEARNFITAREMILDDHWVLTTMNGEARYQKPPLPTWLSVISTLIIGANSVFAMRLPSLLMVILVGIYMFKLSKLFLSKQHSLVNALIVITSFYVIGIIIEAPWDIFAHGFMLIAIYHLFLLFSSNSKTWRHTLLAGIFIGFSILSKGPVSLYVLLISFLIAYGFSFKYEHIKSKFPQIISFIIIAFFVGGWWYLYVRMEDPETFTAIANRETGNWSSYNVRPFYYYWSFFAQSGLWTIPAFISLLYPYLKSRVINNRAYKFSFLWTITALILLSIIPEKKSRYLMPVLIPLAINIGFYLEYLFREFKNLKNKKETIPVYFNFGLIAFIGLAIPFIIYFLSENSLDGYWVNFSLLSVASIILSILLVVQLKRKNIQYCFYLAVMFFSALLLFGIPLNKAFITKNYKSIENLNEVLNSQEINAYGYKNAPEVIWQFGDKIPKLEMKNKTLSLPNEKKFAFISNKTKEELVELFDHKVLIKEIETYNLNTNNVSSRQYKERLISKYYIIQKL